jgi:hypothetical protein
MLVYRFIPGAAPAAGQGNAHVSSVRSTDGERQSGKRVRVLRIPGAE